MVITILMMMMMMMNGPSSPPGENQLSSLSIFAPSLLTDDGLSPWTQGWTQGEDRTSGLFLLLRHTRLGAAPRSLLQLGDSRAKGQPDRDVLAVATTTFCEAQSPGSSFSRQPRDFPGGPVVKTPCFQCRGARVQPLVGELRSHMPRGAALPPKRRRPRISSFFPTPPHPCFQSALKSLEEDTAARSQASSGYRMDNWGTGDVKSRGLGLEAARPGSGGY